MKNIRIWWGKALDWVEPRQSECLIAIAVVVVIILIGWIFA